MIERENNKFGSSVIYVIKCTYSMDNVLVNVGDDIRKCELKRHNDLSQFGLFPVILKWSYV